MTYNPDTMLFKKTPREVVLQVKVDCQQCGLFFNDNCGEHNTSIEDVPIMVVGIPWAKLNYIKSQSIKFDDDGKTQFDGQGYYNECLKQMIIEAPWGETTDLFLLQVGEHLGGALEKIVPSTTGNKDEDKKKQDFSEIKKE